ncbi:mitochondrial genome maintenance exonuclease 1-like [Microplitis mediator]|uniref:mitochondrial genome maintenance exonuclease 1-like n=1 Tax=Microplitis mediator TaxID=375433 RepID=UPI00255546EA|nr:mitochondrial genome maintenance exonuclease 1-like [Microplitis mediator]
MFKFSNMPVTICYLNCTRIFIRNKSKYLTKAEVIKRLMKEQTKSFGPLLENSKQRKKRLKSIESNIKVESTTNNNNNNNNNNNSSLNLENSEFLWTINSANNGNLKLIKTDRKENSKQSLSFKEYNNKNNNSINNILPSDLIVSNDKNENRKKTLPENKYNKNDNRNQLNDSVKLNEDNLSSNKLIKPEVNIKNSSNFEITNFPLIKTPKDDQDYWKISEIITQPLIESKNFSLPGVTKILSATMSDEAKLMLENWKKKMILKLGVEGFEKYNQDLLNDSKIMHSLIGNTLMKEQVDVPDHLKLTYSSIKLILKDVTDVRLIESHVVHPTLGYRGIIDCVACYRGTLCLIDWKKSEKIKTLSSIYDSPLQLSAYIGALNSDPNYPFKVKTGVLAIAYVDGQPPSVFEFTASKLEFYWQEWLKRVKKYYST